MRRGTTSTSRLSRPLWSPSKQPLLFLDRASPASSVLGTLASASRSMYTLTSMQEIIGLTSNSLDVLHKNHCETGAPMLNPHPRRIPPLRRASGQMTELAEIS